MATALSEKNESLSIEKTLLEEVFEVETRPDGEYYIYNYDQMYYKVLSACAKLKLKIRNLPEGNPSYVEVRAEEWDRAMTGSATVTPIPSARPAPVVQPFTAVAEDEPDIARAVERLAARSAAPVRAVEKETLMEETRPVRLEDTQKASYQSKIQVLKSREHALSTREEAVRLREEAVQQREAAVSSAEEDLFANEQRLASKEKDLEAFSSDLDAMRRELDEETEYLKGQRKQMLDLAEHLRKSADTLMGEES
jgi:hypothetical protein